jgi:hypothetical protein
MAPAMGAVARRAEDVMGAGQGVRWSSLRCPGKMKSFRIGDVIGLCTSPRRHGRACPGHPKANAEHSSARGAAANNFGGWRWLLGVDARHKAGHDVLGLQKAERCNLILFPG